MSKFFSAFKNKILGLASRFSAFLQGKKEIINKAYFIVVIVYFVLVFLPNITTNTPLSSFFNAGMSKVIYRVVLALSFGAISFAAFIANKIAINRIFAILLIGFFVFLIIGSFFNLKPVTAYYIDNYYEKVVIKSTTGIINLLAYYGNLAFSYVFCFALFTCIPYVLNEKKRLIVFLDCFIAIILILCFISYFKDFKLYISAIKFDYNQYGSRDISSLFASKNAFGVFLFQGAVAALIAHHYRQDFKLRFLYIIISSQFCVTILFTMCKDAIFTLILFVIVFFIYFVKKPNKKVLDIVSICIWGLTLALSLFVVFLIFNQHNLSNNSFFKKIYYFLGANPVSGNDNAFFGRLEIIIVFFMGIRGIHYIFGYGQALPVNAYIWSLSFRGEGNENLHNSFLHVFGTGGILYFLFYIAIIGYVFYYITKIKKTDKKSFYLLLGLMVAHTFYSLFETSIIFLSGSSATMLLSIVVVSLLKRHPIELPQSTKKTCLEVNI